MKPQLWGVSADVAQWAGLGDSELWQSVAFIVIAELYSTLIHLPFELYSTFVIEQQFGFNKQTLSVPPPRLCRSPLVFAARVVDRHVCVCVPLFLAWLACSCSSSTSSSRWA